MGRLFGTDGVRGVANRELTPELAMDIGCAAAYVLTRETGKRAKVLIGKDTRVSSDMLENALAAGICAAGADVVLLGFVPTPAVAHLVKAYRADAGIVVSASHNPMEYNGIKIFNGEGFKLADVIEDEIESYILDEEKRKAGRRFGGEIGSISFAASAADDYVGYLAECIGGDLGGVTVAVDCANGAAYETAQKLFSRLGAHAFFSATAPDGRNINDGVGSTHLENVRNLVLSTGAMIGIAFDGDADRCLAVDENGEEIDGDKIIAIFANHMKKKKKLRQDTAVVTVMTNLGFVDYCDKYGIKTVRTAVGDRYVLEEMLKSGYNLGGEQSGHVILLDHSTTGDGELTAAMLLSILKESGQKASALAEEIGRYPQTLVNVHADAKQKSLFRENEEIASFIDEQEKLLGRNGRVVVRVSGTEPLIRIMVEAKSETEMLSIADAIRERVEAGI